MPGGELDIAELDRPADELRRFGLAGSPRYLLVETPYLGWPLDFAERVFRLASAGIRAVIAHPERNPDVQERPELVEQLVNGRRARAADGGVDRRPVRCACTQDVRPAHRPGACASRRKRCARGSKSRAIGLSAACAEIGDETLARYLTVDVPGAIVASATRRRGRRRDGRAGSFGGGVATTGENVRVWGRSPFPGSLGVPVPR